MARMLPRRSDAAAKRYYRMSRTSNDGAPELRRKSYACEFI